MHFFHEKCFKQVFNIIHCFFVFYCFSSWEKYHVHNCFSFVAKYFIVQKFFECMKVIHFIEIFPDIIFQTRTFDDLKKVESTKQSETRP